MEQFSVYVFEKSRQFMQAELECQLEQARHLAEARATQKQNAAIKQPRLNALRRLLHRVS